jgi:threonine/homoserine/homoserine lactone efflux protein
MLQNLISFAILAWLLTMLPGIDTAQVLRAVAIGGKKQAYATLFGIMCGVWIWGIGAALGISALLVASKSAYLVLKIIGAGYLLYLGLKMIWESRIINSESITARIEEKKDFRKTFNMAFLITFTNPKNGAFYVAILPVFLPEGMPAFFGGLILSTIHNLCCLVWFTMMIYGANFAKETLRKPNVQKIVERVSGIALIGFGIKLAMEKHE